MFKDKKEELRRLEEALLMEDEPEEEAQLPEEEPDVLSDDEYDFGEESEETYHNYSNRYGRVRAYNNDTTEEDLDAYSDDVYNSENRKSMGCLSLLAVGLLVAIAIALGWCYLRYKGIV